MIRAVWFIAYCIVLFAAVMGINYWAALYGAPQSLWLMHMLGWL